MNKISLFIILATLSLNLSANYLYRAASSDDKGAYYIVESKPLENNKFYVLTSRVGKNKAYTDFTKLNIDCASKKYFELAGSSADGFHEKPTKKFNDWSKRSKWTSLVSGSSQSYLVHFICKKYYGNQKPNKAFKTDKLQLASTRTSHILANSN